MSTVNHYTIELWMSSAEQDGALEHIRIWRLPMASDEAVCRILRRMSEDDEYYIRDAVAERGYIPMACACEIYTKLSKDPSPEIKYARATGATKYTGAVRETMANHGNLPPQCACDIFKRLSEDTYSTVRLGVANNSHVPEECRCDILTKLSFDDSSGVIWNVLSALELDWVDNVQTTKSCACEILSKLRKDEDDDISSKAHDLAYRNRCWEEG